MRRIALIMISIFVVSACIPTLPATQTPADSEAGQNEVRTLVETFGKRLKMVSLLAPDASAQIQQQYSDLVSQDLLQSWMNDPISAPGRLTSSPWPDRIEITSIEPLSSEEFLVTGMVIEITSNEEMNGGVAAQYPVEIKVAKASGFWLISGWQAGEYQ